MTTYSEYAKKIASYKIVLAWLEPSKRLLLWENESGEIWKKKTNFYLIGLNVSKYELTEVFTLSLNRGDFFYDVENGHVYCRLPDGSDPNSNYMVGFFRMFFSNAPLILTHDLTDSGNEVYYEEILSEVSEFIQELDNNEQIGISLETSGSFELINDHGYFDNIYDKYIFENKKITIYSWSEDIPFSEKRKLFEGLTSDKTFDYKKVTFKISDFISQLRKLPDNGYFSELDGRIQEDIIGRPKRRIYGRVSGLRMTSVDVLGPGLDLTGTITGTIGDSQVIGNGTKFLSELDPSSTLKMIINNEEIEVQVDSVQTDEIFTASGDIESNFSNQAATYTPKFSSERSNRRFLIAGHKLAVITTSVSQDSTVLNRVYVNSIEHIEEGDLLTVGTQENIVKRTSGNLIIFRQNFNTLPTTGQTVQKSPVYNVYFNKRKLIKDRDWTLDNLSSGSYVDIDTMAEFNITPEITMSGSFTFTNGSREVTVTGNDLKTELQPNDWIKSDDITHVVYYQILQIPEEGKAILRIAYAGTNNTGSAFKKNVDYIKDESTVTIDCLGKENSSFEWIKNASEAVKDLLEDAGITNIDSDSFDQAEADAPYTISMALPLGYSDDELINIRETITLVNKSVFGSLVSKNDFSIAYNVLSPERPANTLVIEDDDILSHPKVDTKTIVYRRIVGKYRFYDADRYSGESGSLQREFINEFVENLIQDETEKEIEIYLYDEYAAQNIVERYSLFHSISRSIVKINGKLNLSLLGLNDKLFTVFRRMYNRFGDISNNRKFGIVSKVTKDGINSTVEIADLGNLFNRVAAIASDDSSDYTSATDDDKIYRGYIVDDNLEIPDVSSEEEWGTNLIG